MKRKKSKKIERNYQEAFFTRNMAIFSAYYIVAMIIIIIIKSFII